jgi:hypothetical protein
MKTITATLACLLVMVLSLRTGSAGTITLRNDWLFDKAKVTVKHHKQTLVKTWLEYGQVVQVEIDETKSGRPVLTIVHYSTLLIPGFGRGRPIVYTGALPKKQEPLFYNLSHFTW